MTVCRHPKKARFRGLFRAPGGGDNVLGRRSSVPECLTSQPSAQRFLMALHLAYALLARHQAAHQPAPPPLTLPQPIARVDLKPGEYALQVGDTVRIHATAYDSSGQAMPQAVIRWFASGGRFEGAVDSTGLVSAGATGTLNVAAVATLPGRAAKSTVAFARITVLPQPAAKIAVTPRPERMLAGTSLVLEAVPYAANNDRRYDRVTWKSSRPGVVDVTPIGRVTARAPGGVVRPGRASQHNASGHDRRAAGAQGPSRRRAVAPSGRQTRLHVDYRRPHLRNRHLGSGEAVLHGLGARGRTCGERRDDD